MNFKISYIEHGLVKWWLRQERICLQSRRPGFDPYVRQIPWRREWLHTPVLLLVESHQQGNIAGYHPRGHKDLDTAERLILSLQISLLSENSYRVCEGNWIQPNSWNNASREKKIIWHSRGISANQIVSNQHLSRRHQIWLSSACVYPKDTAFIL